MSINKANFHTTIPNDIAVRLETTKERLESDFTVYSMDDFNRFILYEDGVFIFLLKNESNDIVISSNEEFNIILSSSGKDTFKVDFLIDHT